MRTAMLLLITTLLLAQTPDPTPEQIADAKAKTVGTMSQLMVDVIYPTSNDLFYIFREPPANEVAWNKMKTSALTMAESANLLMAPERSRGDKWNVDAKLLLDVGRKAYTAAVKEDWMAIEALNQELNDACVACHQDFRPIFQKGKGKAKAK